MNIIDHYFEIKVDYNSDLSDDEEMEDNLTTPRLKWKKESDQSKFDPHCGEFQAATLK